jgi:peptide/nickel transport system substrate-binding protein
VASPVGPFSDTFNPFSVSNTAYVQGATGMVYEPLIQFNLDKPGQIYPWLAKSWAWADGGKELIVHTRTGVKWSDGKPFSAADVAYTFNLMKKHAALDVNGVTFSGASAPSATEAIIKFPHPAYSQLFDISEVLIVPQHIWSTVSNPVTYTDTSPVGTGPYKVESFSPQQFTLTKNASYWQAGKPQINTLRFIAYASNPSAGLALNSGQIDWSTAYIPNYKQTFVAKSPSTNHAFISAVGNWFMCPNLTQAPFNQAVVRKAISESIDRQTITSEGEHGYYVPTTSATGLTLPRWKTQLASSLANDTTTYNPAAAKAMLERAGFKPGAGGMLNQPNGKPFKVTLLGPSPYTDFMTDLQLMSTEMKKAGIDATVNGVSVSDWTNDYTTGNYQLTFCGEFTTSDPYSVYNAMLNSALTAPVNQNATGDFERYKNPAVNQALQQVAATNSSSQQLKAYATIESAMVNDVPLIPLMDGGAWGLYSTRHAVGWPSTSNDYEMNEVATPWDEVVMLHLKPR